MIVISKRIYRRFVDEKNDLKRRSICITALFSTDLTHFPLNLMTFYYPEVSLYT